MSGRCVGLFGLRKIGKTSLLLRLVEKFQDAAPGQHRVVPMHLDLQTLSFDRKNLSGLFQVLNAALADATQRAGFPANDRQDPTPFADRFEALLSTRGDAPTPRFLMIVDEYERLLDGRIPQQDGAEFLAWLRGLAQTHADRFSFILAGRNRRLLAPASIGGYDNPLYRFLHEVPLGGLAPDDCRQMVRKIGRRLQLRFQSDALDLVVAESGGHPFLARMLGDLVDQRVPAASRTPADVTRATVESILPAFRTEADEDMRLLLDAATDVDQQASDRLVHLAHGIPWLGGVGRERVDAALVQYGMLHDSLHFRIGALAHWLRENYAAPHRAAHG